MLVARDLPKNVTREMLSALFGQCSGFKEVHMQGRLAVAVYANSHLCALAKETRKEFEWIPGKKIMLDFAPPESESDDASAESETA